MYYVSENSSWLHYRHIPLLSVEELVRIFGAGAALSRNGCFSVRIFGAGAALSRDGCFSTGNHV